MTKAREHQHTEQKLTKNRSHEIRDIVNCNSLIIN